MRAVIHDSFPSHAVFGEEGGMHAGEPLTEGSSRYLWVLDPIDGTKSFITGAGRALSSARTLLSLLAAPLTRMSAQASRCLARS